jgi:hypothetical protein
VTRLIVSVLGIVGVLIWLVGPAAAGNEALEPFLGPYAGKSDPVANDETLQRDLGVIIEEADDDGFRLTWTTARNKAYGRRKEREISIEFVPIRREGMFSSAMRRNKFGHHVPLDPLKGDPYVWAKVQDKTLLIHALIITEDGGYEMQTYKRALVDGGLDLRFDRIRDGINLRSITGTLRRLDN